MHRRVELVIGAETFDAEVALESENGRSLILTFDGEAPLNGPKATKGSIWTSVGLLPVVYTDGRWFDILTCSTVSVTPKNPFARIAMVVGAKFPQACLTLFEPELSDGTWALEIDHVCDTFWLEWAPFTGFGLARISGGYFEPWDEVAWSPRGIARRMIEVLQTPRTARTASFHPETGGEG